MKISVHRKEMGKLREAFPNITQQGLYKVLRYESHSIQASRIRCYAMNHLQRTILYTSYMSIK